MIDSPDPAPTLDLMTSYSSFTSAQLKNVATRYSLWWQRMPCKVPPAPFTLTHWRLCLHLSSNHWMTSLPPDPQLTPIWKSHERFFTSMSLKGLAYRHKQTLLLQNHDTDPSIRPERIFFCHFSGLQNRSSTHNFTHYISFISTIGPKKVNVAKETALFLRIFTTCSLEIFVPGALPLSGK